MLFYSTIEIAFEDVAHAIVRLLAFLLWLGTLVLPPASFRGEVKGVCNQLCRPLVRPEVAIEQVDVRHGVAYLLVVGLV